MFLTHQERYSSCDPIRMRMGVMKLQVGTRGRPRNVGPISEVDRERGRRIAAWIRSGMDTPHQPIQFSKADVARLTGLSNSIIGYYLNDCYDNLADRMRFPKDENIQKIATALKLNYEEGLSAKNWTPKPTRRYDGSQTKKVYVGEYKGEPVEIIVPDEVPESELNSISDFIRYKLSRYEETTRN